MHSLYGPNGTLGGEEPTLIAHVPNIHQEIKDLTVCAGDNKYPVIYGILGNLVFNLDVWRPNIPLFIKISGTCNSGGRTRMGPSACLEPSAVITNVNCLQNGKLLLDTDTERRVVYDPETETLEDYPYSGPIFSIPSLSPTGSSLSTIPTSCPVKTETLGSNGKGWGTCSIDGMGVCQSETSCGWTNADGDISQTVSCAQRSPCKCPNTGGQSV